jgi:hypothetical protein
MFNNLGYIDMAPSLRAMAQQPYFANADGHPNAIGNKEIAALAIGWFRP